MLRYSYLLWVLVLVASLCCTGPCADAQITSQTEVSALRVIRRSLTDPYKRLNWTKGDPCTSNWTGVVCFNTTLDDGYLHVRELQLWSMNFSGSLSPELGQLLRMNILSFMWNQLGGSIPKEIGNIKSLELLLLNGNQLSGTLPDELGYLPNLDRIQIDENQISGPLPKSFANLNKTKHFHMNNNSISGQIPPELSRLPSLVHFLLDNNNLSGHLPEEFFMLPNLLILQLDNNNFSGTSIPTSYGNMTKLLKLSLRNCSLQGQIPDLSRIPELGYIDLSWNQLTGTIPENKLSNNITTIDLSNNNLTGLIPANFSDLPLLQKLSLNNNSLSGSVSSLSWEKVIFNATARLILDFENNFISNISGVLRPPASVTLMLQGNPVCANANQLNITQFCGPHTGDEKQGNSTPECHCATDLFLEHIPAFYPSCFCAAPLRVGYRLKSPGLSDFPPYLDSFHAYLSSGLGLILYQLSIDSFIWEEGPRLRMYLKIFPPRNVSKFNASEIRRIRRMFSGWNIEDNNIFGPYELLNFTLLGPYSTDMVESNNSGLKKGVVVGIVLGAVAASVTLSAIVSIIILRMRRGYHHGVSQKRAASKAEMRIEGVKGFTFTEMSAATNNFDNSTQVGQGGYGKVYKGILTDGTVVAIKRAQEGSLQGSKEFYTEIELLSRLHHRNLVSLIGYCDEEDEQMLVYEFMSNGTLHDHLSGKIIEPLSFSMRLRIALGSAKGILYLHTEADPPLFHRDIKATNILLDSKFTAKVADFGLSRLAPVLEADGTVPGYVSTVVKGTPGYLDPEYFLTHKLTDKSDVYSLGIVFLELLTGMRPISHGKNIVREVNMACQSGTVFSVIDDRMGSYPSECVGRFMSLALRCCHDETDARPSMVEVMRELDLIMQMTLEADPAETHPRKSDATKPSSMKATGHPYLSIDVSGSNLDSCILPTIAPR